jgi:hypothetical protein
LLALYSEAIAQLVPDMKKLANELRIHPGEEVDLKRRPTSINPVYESRGEYKQLLDEHVAV